MAAPDGRALGVAVADRTPIYARGVRAIVADAPDLEFLGAGSTRAEMQALIGLDTRAVCLWDARLDDSGFTQAAALLAERPRVAVLIVAPRPTDVTSAIGAGAAGVIARDVGPRDLLAALATAGAGRTVLASDAAGMLLDQVVASVRGHRPGLTHRERQVLELMGRGWGNRAIAEELFISENTVKNHVRRIHEKLGVHSRTEAVVRAAREGIVDLA